jgi:hypothetical protein
MIQTVLSLLLLGGTGGYLLSQCLVLATGPKLIGLFIVAASFVIGLIRHIQTAGQQG